MYFLPEYSRNLCLSTSEVRAGRGAEDEGAVVAVHLPLTKTGTADPSLQPGQGFITVQFPFQNYPLPKGEHFGYLWLLPVCTIVWLQACVSTIPDFLLKMFLCSCQDGCLGSSLSHILPDLK